jgi:hypothetical protein
MARKRATSDRTWKLRLEGSTSYALSCWILVAAVILLVFVIGAMMLIAFDPDLLNIALWLTGIGWLVHLVLFIMLYRSLDSDLLLNPIEAADLKRLVLLLGYIGALETFHVLRRAARTKSNRGPTQPALQNTAIGKRHPDDYGFPGHHDPG